MKNISTIALLSSITLMLVLTACSTASKHELAPVAAAPTPMYMPKADRN
jgi:hypothetical protein